METIDKTTLKAKLESLDGEFYKVENAIKKTEDQERQLAHQKSELNVELFRLQGEHRLLTDLLKEEEKKEPYTGDPLKAPTTN